jgi:putative transferase (TIGR04331 family)
MKKNLLCILTDEDEYLRNEKNFLIIDKNILDILNARNFFNKKRKYLYVNNINNKINNKNYINRNIFFVKKKFLIYKKQLVKKLNQYHNISENNSYWGKIVDSWLLNLIVITKFRFDNLLFLHKKYNNIYIANENRIKIYNNSEDFYQNASYCGKTNQFIYSRIAKVLGMNVSKNIYLKNYSYKNYFIDFKGFIFKIIFILYIKLFKPIVFFSTDFSRFDKIKLFILSKGNIFFNNISYLKQKSFFNKNLDKNFRKTLKFNEVDNFDKSINALIQDLIPTSFVENFFLIRKDLDVYSRHLSGVGTSYNFYSDDLYKILSAQILKNKGKLFIFEHGHYHLFYNRDLRFDIEKNNLDFYFMWNSKNGIGTANFTHLGSSKKNQNNNSNITLFLEPKHKYNIKLTDTLSKDLKEKSLDSFSFYNYLFPSLKSEFVLRPPQINSYDFQQWNKILYKNKKEKSGIINLSSNSKNLLHDTRIFVANYFGNSFFEALYLNIPIVIFFDLNLCNFNKETKLIFNKFKKLNIFHEDAKSASDFINLNYDTINFYWNSKDIQEALNEFRSKFFNKKINYIKNILYKTYI